MHHSLRKQPRGYRRRASVDDRYRPPMTLQREYNEIQPELKVSFQTYKKDFHIPVKISKMSNCC